MFWEWLIRITLMLEAVILVLFFLYLQTPAYRQEDSDNPKEEEKVEDRYDIGGGD